MDGIYEPFCYLELKHCVSVGSENSAWMVKMLQLDPAAILTLTLCFRKHPWVPPGSTKCKVHVLSVRN